MLEDQLVSHLRSDGTVAALAGNRIYAMGDAPQGEAQPHVTYMVTGNDRIEPIISGAGGSTFYNQFVQIDCWAQTREGVSGQATVLDMARAVRSALDYVQLPGEDDVDRVWWDDWRDLPEQGWARRQMDFVCRVRP